MRTLIALDIHEVGQSVIDEARPWVERFGARADVIYATGYEAPDRWFTDDHMKDIARREWEGHKAGMRDTLDAWLRVLPAAFRGDVFIVDGDAAEAVAAHAPAYDLVIVGTHGRRGLSRAFSGSVAEAVARHSAVPVLVIRLSEAS